MRTSRFVPAVVGSVLLTIALGSGAAGADPSATPVLPSSSAAPISETAAPTSAPPTSAPPTSAPTSAPTSTVPTSSAQPTTTPGLPTTTVDNPVPVDQGMITVSAGKVPGNTPIGGVVARVAPCGGDFFADLTTRDDGNASRGVAFGCYQVSFWGSPGQYDLVSGKAVTLNLTAANPDGVAKFDFREFGAGDSAIGSLVKKDRVTGALLGGATYEVMNCHQVPGDDVTVTTGPDGTAALDLPFGCHKAVEKVAPAGYVLDSTAVYFDVQPGAPFTVTALDTPVSSGPVVRNPAARVPLQSIPSGPIEHP